MMGKRTSSTSSSTGATPSGVSSSSSAAWHASNAVHYAAIKAEIDTSYRELFDCPTVGTAAVQYNNNRCWACPRLHIDRDWHEKLYNAKSNANLVLRERGITVLTQLHAQTAKTTSRSCMFRNPADTSKTYYTVTSEPLVRLQWLNRDRLQICFDCERAKLRTIFTAPQVYYQRVHACNDESQLTAVDLTDDGSVIVTADTSGNLILSELSSPTPAADSNGGPLTLVGGVKKLRHLSTKSIQKEVGAPVWRHISSVRFVRGQNNHKYFVSGDHYGNLVVWDYEKHHWEMIKYDESMPDRANFITTGIWDLRFLSADKIVTAHNSGKVGGAVIWSIERKRSIDSITDAAYRAKRLDSIGTGHVVPLHVPSQSTANEDANVLLMASANVLEIDVIDLRVLSNTKTAVQQFNPAVGISSICALPRRPFQFATSTAHGHISYYDLRVPNKSLFTISEQIRGCIYQIIPFRRDIIAATHDGVPLYIDFDDDSVRFASDVADKTSGGGSGIVNYELTGGGSSAFEQARTLKAIDNDTNVFVGYSDKSVAKYHVPLNPSSSTKSS